VVVDEDDRRLRNRTYRMFVDLGRAPSAAEVALVERTTAPDVEATWWRLHDAHALVLHPNGEIRMANPFSAVPTAHRVRAARRSWFANCAWDAIGICAALYTDGDIESSCPCCGEAIALSIRAATPSVESLLFHCLVPARSWWDDIGFT
jgi:Alkylmercury lyase